MCLNVQCEGMRLSLAAFLTLKRVEFSVRKILMTHQHFIIHDFGRYNWCYEKCAQFHGQVISIKNHNDTWSCHPCSASVNQKWKKLLSANHGEVPLQGNAVYLFNIPMNHYLLLCKFNASPLQSLQKAECTCDMWCIVCVFGETSRNVYHKIIKYLLFYLKRSI